MLHSYWCLSGIIHVVMFCTYCLVLYFLPNYLPINWWAAPNPNINWNVVCQWKNLENNNKKKQEKSCACTWPEMKPVKGIGVEIITNTIAPPALSTPRVGGIAFSGGPAYTEMSGFTGDKMVYLINHQLKVPLLILSWSLAYAQEDVGSHAVNRKKNVWNVYLQLNNKHTAVYNVQVIKI